MLDWAKADKSGFLDLAKGLRNTPDGLSLTFAQNITVAYGVWAAFTLFGLTVVLVLLAGIPLPQSAAGNTYARVVGALIVGLGAVGQIVTMTQLFKGDPTPQFGAWLGLIGWFVIAVGFVLGARRTSA